MAAKDDEEERLRSVALQNAQSILRARRRAEEALRKQTEWLRITLASIGDAVISTDADGRITFMNGVAEALTGWTQTESLGRDLLDVFHIVNERTRQPVENPALRALRAGTIVGLANHTILVARNGAEYPIDDSAAPIKDESGTVVGSVLIFRDISERKRAEETLAEQARLMALSADVGMALTQSESFPDALQRCAAALVEHLHGAFARIWTLNREGDVLELRASAGQYTHLDGSHSRVPLGQFKIGLIAQERKPHLTNAVVGDPQVSEQEWARQEGMVSFAGYPLLVEDRLVGVMAMFGRRPLSDATLGAMASVAKSIALGIERKQDQERLREQRESLRASEQRFRQLADAMPQIVFTATADGQADYCNRRWYDFTGLPDGEVSSESWLSAIHPDDRKGCLAEAARTNRTGTPFEMELRFRNGRTGQYRWHLARSVPVRDETGQVVRWYGTSTDIHDRKRAADAARFLARASAALASVVDYESTLQKVAGMAVPYFADWSAVDMTNEDGSLRRLAVVHQDPEKVQLARELMRRYPPDLEAPGGIANVLRSGQPEMVGEVTDAMLVQGAIDEEHLRSIRALGLRSYICVPLVVSGKTLGALTFATAESGRGYDAADLALAEDLTRRAATAIENAQLYRELQEADRRKDEFLATLAHELRNPLAPIRNSLQILKMSTLDALTIERSREMMERQMQHLVRLVDDLLDVSRVMRGKIELRKEQVELSTIIARAVETVQPLIEAQGHELTLNLPPESLLLEADAVRLSQVVGNLLANAAKYTEPNGRIWLTARRERDEAVLRVRDSGIGIAPEMLPKVFDLFVQVDQAATRSQGGLGIGLTLVRNLVLMHRGSVEARSTGLGQGSEFVVRLPLSTAKVTLPASQVEDEDLWPESSSGLRVLVVDDNRDAANSLALLLRLQGHDVRVAHDGATALELTADYRPALVLLDIGMPGMDGYEVARRLRRQPGLENVLLAALTGWGQQEDRRRSAEAGFDHHLVKPVEPNAVQALLDGLSK